MEVYGQSPSIGIKMETPSTEVELEALAEALGCGHPELEQRIFELGLAVLAYEAERLSEAPLELPNSLELKEPKVRLVHWFVAASNLLPP